MGQSRNRQRGNDTRHLRIPPQSVEAEQAVLGGLMLSPERLDTVTDLLRAESFYRKDHQLIYQSILDLDRVGKPYDAVTMGEWFDSKGMSEMVAGGAYLIELASTTPSAANITAYAEIVADKALLRDLIEVSTETVNEAFFPDGEESQDILHKAEHRVFELANNKHGRRDPSVSAKRALAEAFEEVQRRYEAGGQVIGVETGYTELDKITTGLQDTDLVILAARPSQGKTTLALNIAEFAASRKNVPVHIFSMEMSAKQLMMKVIASRARINSQKLRTGEIEDEDWTKISSALGDLASMPLHIDDTPALSPEELRSRARRKKREINTGLIVVDYLQLMQVPYLKDNRTSEISEISRSLKALAKELKVPVLALSQLNRGVESRQDKRPVMSDLRESGAIEQDADVIAFIYRDELYNKDSTDKGLAEIIISKQRNGPTGSVSLRFFGEFSRFENAERSDENETF